LNSDLEARVRQRTAELEVANRELEAFTYSVSHDLRAPLRHIAGFSKILMDEFEASLAPEARHYLSRILDGTHRMGLLVDELLNLARVGRYNLRLHITDLNGIIEELMSMLIADCKDRSVEWRIAKLPQCECDPILIKQVMQNLLLNAIKFTRTREQAIIEIGVTQRENKTAIFVRDNGVGFDMKYADKLFGVFQRLHRAEDFEGTGVGLATVQRIVQRHGGQIWAESELDRSTTFTFTLSGFAHANASPPPEAVAHASA
jgi:light-regulated signal transduction histidine kinase (bacteriophytochrome)